MKKLKNYLRPFVLFNLLILVVFVKFFILDKWIIFWVSGPSMEPTLHNSQKLLATKIFQSIEKDDLIIFNHERELIVKRVTGIPGDAYIENIVSSSYRCPVFGIKKIHWQEKYLKLKTIPANYYFVSGDNSGHSYDSHDYGLISIKDIVAKVCTSN